MRRPWACLLMSTAALVWLGASRPAADVSVAHRELVRADRLYDDSEYHKAIPAYRLVRQLDPALVEHASSRLVVSLLRVGEFALASRESAALAVRFPRSASAIALDGEALWSNARFSEADERFRDALAIGQPDARAHNGRARTFIARSQLALALAETHAALGLAQNEAEYHYTQAAVFERLGRYPESAVALERFIARLPTRGYKNKRNWAQSRIRFLRAFDGRRPVAMADAVRRTAHVVPFRLMGDKVVVPARLNGQPPRDFVVDTGAEMTVISKTHADRLKIKALAKMVTAGVGDIGLRSLEVARLDSLEIGTFRAENVPIIIKNPPLKNLPAPETEGFSPVALGLSMTVDYGRREVTLGPVPPDDGADVALPLWMYRLAMVEGRLNGRNPATFIVDTGGEALSISHAAARGLEQLRRFRRIPLKVFGTSGWDRDAFLLPGVNLAFDTVRMEKQSLVVIDLRAPSVLLGFELGGILGHRFLSNYRVTLDLDQSVVRLKRLGA
jgi:tetratricopeptide (TPR) repeat protein